MRDSLLHVILNGVMMFPDRRLVVVKRGARRGVVVIPWVIAAGLCACSGTNLTGDAGDVPLNPSETIGTPCTAAAECDDGEPCNGEEACSPETGRCVGGVALPDFVQCETSDGRYASCVNARCDLDYEEMFVPAGPFVMGCDPDDPEDRCPDIIGIGPFPEMIVEVSGYFIDRYEVTNARYRRCQRFGACPAEHGEMSNLNDWYFSNPAFQDYPVVTSPQSEAEALCAYEGKRLPTEAEWEKAARGGCELVAPPSCGQEDERWLPWDDPPLGDEYRTCEHSGSPECYRDPKRVGSHPLGRSPYGVDDMLGNVEEWTRGCAFDYADYAPTCADPWQPCAGVPPWEDPPIDVSVARGGSFMDNASLIYRHPGYPTGAATSLGFRCVRPVSVSKNARAAEGGSLVRLPSGGEGSDDADENLDRYELGIRALGMPRAGGVPPRNP